MLVSKVGQRRQVVIPKTICEQIGLREGDFVEVTTSRRGVLIRPKRLVDADDVLTPAEAARVRKGERQLRRGEYLTLERVIHELGRTPIKRRR